MMMKFRLIVIDWNKWSVWKTFENRILTNLMRSRIINKFIDLVVVVIHRNHIIVKIIHEMVINKTKSNLVDREIILFIRKWIIKWIMK